MSKIIKVQEIVDYAVNTTFTKDFGLFQVKATIWSCVSECENGYDNEITETELMFILNGKVCKYAGFRELYEKLYGINMFNQFWSDLVVEFEEEYFKQTNYKTK
jgi:hypothetical protein